MTVKRSNSKTSKVEEMLAGTKSLEIWNEIKDQTVDMFSLPNQKIEQFAQPALVEPDKLYLTFRVSSFLPALEAVLSKKFTVELMDKYIVVARIPV